MKGESTTVLVEMRCIKCRTVENHSFKDCVSEKCSCQCVQQLFKKQVQSQVEVTRTLPKFLQIPDKKISRLPRLNEKLLESFTKVRKDEWVPTKIDKRTKTYRNSKRQD